VLKLNQQLRNTNTLQEATIPMNREPISSTKVKSKRPVSNAGEKAKQRYYQMDLFSDSSSELQAETHDQELQYELKGMFSSSVKPKHYED